MKKNKINLLIIVFTISLFFWGCANMHLTGDIGLHYNGGPHGGSVEPYFNVGVYGGGHSW